MAARSRATIQLMLGHADIDRARAPGSLRRSATLLLVTATAPLVLGIATLLFAVPVPFAVLHQGWALVVLLAALRCRHGVREA